MNTDAASSWTCPECGGGLFNGQGLRGCLDCDWTEDGGGDPDSATRA